MLKLRTEANHFCVFASFCCLIVIWISPNLLLNSTVHNSDKSILYGFYVHYKRIFLHFHTEQCLNLAPKLYFCYVSWLRLYQLFTVLTGVILKSLIMLSRTLIGLGDILSERTHKLSILAISDFRFLCPTGSSRSKFEPML